MENSGWRELLPEKKPNFIGILKILNRYYSSQLQNPKERDGHLFRKKLEIAPLHTISIFIKKFGRYEYLIHAKLVSKPKEKEIPDLEDTWIHFDGIQEERDQFMEKGIQEHPVFHIESMSDIFQTGTAPTTRLDLP